MSWYRTLWPLVRRIDPETAHHWAVRALATGLFSKHPPPDDPILESRRWGRLFPNPIGLAAGLDKDGVAPGAFFGMGFGFVEVGTVTPLPQPGNPTPRLFRLVEDRAIINRFGFNNAGMDAMAARLSPRHAPGILGINLGKNKTTEDAASDYEKAIGCLAPLADYLVLNVSSPNTPGLRALQSRAALEELLTRARKALDALKLDAPPPLLLKIAPDLTDEDLADIATIAVGEKARLIDGLICTNTTLARPESLQSTHKGEAGGLSGAPLKARALEILKEVYRLTNGSMPLVGVGGISTSDDAYERIRAGASLVQLYSALIYEGPSLVRRIKSELVDKMRADGFERLDDVIGVDVK